MNSLETRMRDANPIPDARAEFGSEEIAALLTLTRARSTEMDVKEMTTPVTHEKKGNRGWLVAAAAFALVIVVAVGVALVAQNMRDLEPADTTTPPTTQAAPTTTVESETPEEAAIDAASVAYIESMIAELNSGDHEAAAERIRSAGQFLGDRDGSGSDQLEEYAARFERWTALESVLGVESCETLSSGISRCLMHRTSPFEPFHPLRETTRVEIRVADGELAYMRLKPIETDPWYVEYQTFSEWMLANAPTDVSTEVLFPVDGTKAAGLQRTWVERYRSEGQDFPVEEIFSRWNGGGGEGVLSTLAVDATVDAEVLDQIVFWALVGQQWFIEECATDATETIRCTVNADNPLYEAAGYLPWVWEISLRIEDGLVTYLFADWSASRPDMTDDFVEAWIAYSNWLEENHPESGAQLGFPPQPSMAPAFSEHIAEYASFTGFGD